jgi:hypothetical protein
MTIGEKFKSGRLFGVLRVVRLVQTERDAGFCQPLGVWAQGFLSRGSLAPFAVLFSRHLGAKFYFWLHRGPGAAQAHFQCMAVMRNGHLKIPLLATFRGPEAAKRFKIYYGCT